MRNTSRKRDGFTLIEVLVVLAIIGVVAGIAIAGLSFYRARSYDARIAADARSAASAEAAVFVDNDAYTTSGDCSALPSLTVSSGVTCTLGGTTCADGTPGFTVATSHPRASRSCTWNSCGQTCSDGTPSTLCCS